MKKQIVLASALLVFAVAPALALDPVKSGPQVGKAVPGPFHPLNLTGEFAGQKHCLYCEYGSSPVAMIFARKNSPAVAKLIKQIDSATAKNSKAGLKSCVIFLSDNEKLNDQLKQMAKKEKIQKTVLSIDNPAGPGEYEISRDAEVTVLLYESSEVRANHAFGAGELNDRAITQVVSDLSKILPKR